MPVHGEGNAGGSGPSSRALAPTESGFAETAGVRVGYELFGQGAETLLLLPPWSIIHSRFWKLQVPYLARHFRVLTFDGRGNGRSDRPPSPEQYGARNLATDAAAVLDATDTPDCVLVAHCSAAPAALLVADSHPGRVRGALFMAPALPITPALPERTGHSFDADLPAYDGWAQTNRHFWVRDFAGYLRFFFDRCFPEPHSTKQIEDSIGWGLQTDGVTLARTIDAPEVDAAELDALLSRLRCPSLVVQGDEDQLIPADRGAEFARRTGAALVELEGTGHCPNNRHPVVFNHLVRDFAQRAYGRATPPVRWQRAVRRPRRALMLSSPIGLGHAWRDIAIARELRALHPELEIDWLAQDPVTHVLERCGERVHPASAQLARESPHIAASAHGHELNVFGAWRAMDEILLSNFMVFDDLVSAEPYDLWIGDEAWELDYHLHENPERKRAPYAFLTDFVGWLPMPEGGAREAALTADYNAEMLEQIARFGHVRDRAVFVGSPEDVVPGTFGAGLPEIRPWVEAHFDFCGYVLSPSVAVTPDRDALRAELGWAPDEHVCIVAVGGSGVGGSLLTRAVAAHAAMPGVRMIVVCGPRIDPATVPQADGVEVLGYVHDLARLMAACDVALTQGGLTTCMELAAAGRPFVYAPLHRHFEQNLHVRHRLERYGAGEAIDLAVAGPEEIGAAVMRVLGATARPAPVERDGAARAAALIAELL